MREAVGVPVLAKEFIVDLRQLEQVRAAGADAVLLLAMLHRSKRRLRGVVDAAIALGLEPLVEVHDRRELDLALDSGARLIGINNRDLRTLEVDVERADRLRELVPDDRLVIAESGVRDPSTVARWRALGFDGALVGEALMRSDDPTAATRAFVAAGRQPDDGANVARRPYVKICGITTPEGVSAAVLAGADAIGLNVVAGTPRVLDEAEAAQLAELARALSPGGRTDVVLVTDGAGPTGSRPSPTRSVPMSSSVTTGRLARERMPAGRGARSTCRRWPATARITWPPPGRCSTAAWSGCSSTRPADRTAAAPASGPTPPRSRRSPARCR